MSNIGLKRKKQPDAVRQALLDATMRIAHRSGLAAVTVQAVAQDAGVTKGGLFHHFPTKHALLEGLLVDLMDKLDAQIDELIARDPEPQGSFTRAYVQAMLQADGFAGNTSLAALSTALASEPQSARIWFDWIDGRMSKHAQTDSDPALEIVRFAADGAWYAYIDRAPDAKALAALTQRLVGMTRGAGS